MLTQPRNILATCLFILFISPMNDALAGEFSPRLEMPSSPNPVGSGARAIGMGGAFIAVADDATAVSWNPGGLIQMDHPEISCVGALFHRMEDNTFRFHPEAGGEQTVSETDINYFSATYPFQAWDYNMIVSINYSSFWV